MGTFAPVAWACLDKISANVVLIIIIIISLSWNWATCWPVRSYASRSLFNGLPWFLLPVGKYCFITLGDLLRGILFTWCIQFLLYWPIILIQNISCNVSRARQLSPHISVDASFLCDKATMLRDTVKGTFYVRLCRTIVYTGCQNVFWVIRWQYTNLGNSCFGPLFLTSVIPM